MLARFDKKSFTEMFKKLKAENQLIPDLSEEQLDLIEKEILSIKDKKQSNINKIVYYVTLIFIAIYPLIIGYLYSIIKNLAPVLLKLLQQKSFLNSHIEFNIYFMFLFTATISYTILMPNGGLFFTKKFRSIKLINMPKSIKFIIKSKPIKFIIKSKPIKLIIKFLNTPIIKFDNKNPKKKLTQYSEGDNDQTIHDIKQNKETLRQSRGIFSLSEELHVTNPGKTFIIFAVICNYLNFLIPMMYLYSYDSLHLHIYTQIITVWMIIPLAIFSFFCLITPFSIILKLTIDDSELKLSHEYPILVIAYLVAIIDYLSSKKGFFELRERDKDLLIESIVKISVFIRNMYNLKKSEASQGVHDSLTLWNSEQMEIASQNFLSLITWILFPQESTYANLKNKLLDYLNIFITGEYHNLPREKMEMDLKSKELMHKTSKVKSYFPTMLLGFNMALPIIIYIIIQRLFQISISPQLSFLFNILYLIWVVVVFILYAGNLGPDARDFVKDIMTSIIKKGN